MVNSIKVYPVSEKHKCKSTRFENWVVYTCEKCDYEVWQNIYDRKLIRFNTKADIIHEGWHVDDEKMADDVKITMDLGY